MAAEPAYRIDLPAGGARAHGARPDVRAERMGASGPSATPLLVTAAKMAAIVLVVVTALAFARIALTNAAVVTMIEGNSVAGQISEARSAGVGLEMEQSVLSNASAVKAAAKRLGMAAPVEVGTVALAPDIVAVGGDGSLSLSETVGNLVGSQG